jgi:hypothetical protein
MGSQVIENIGEHFTKAGFVNELQLREANECWEGWAQSELMKQA